MHHKLGVKINLLVVVVLGLLLAAMLVLLHNSASKLTRESGQQRVEQEVEVIQSQFERAQQQIVASANRLAASPDLIAAIQKRQALSSRTNVFLSAQSLGFDAVGLVNA